MTILLSPAKSLNFETPDFQEYSKPRLLEDSQVLVNILKKKTARSLKTLMGVSDKIANLNVQRFQAYEAPFTPQNAKQAVLAFSGDVYSGLQADTFSATDFEFAQQHLRILSGLYGLLKPLDLIQPYRLEMGLKLKNRRKKNLYEFWDSKITDLLNRDLAESGDDIILNLASQEYFRSIKKNLLTGRLVNVHFKEDRNGQLKVISFNAKKARGAMAKQIIQYKITDTEGLKSLNVNDYLFQESISDEGEMVFVKE